MSRQRSFISTFALLLQASVSLSQPLGGSTAQQNGTLQNSVYFTNWGTYSGFTPDKLPVDSITNVIYAFVNLDANGTVFSGDPEADINKAYPGDDTSEDGNNVYGAVKQLGLLKRQNRHLKAILSIGGWSWRGNFASAASTAENRRRFATTAVNLGIRDWGFDGVDVDWEFPADETEAENYVLLLKEIRSELDDYATNFTSSSNNYRFQLSAATAFSDFVALNHIEEMGEVLDSFNIMGYGYVGAWSEVTGHQANLCSSSSSDEDGTTPINGRDLVSEYMDAGAPAGKLVLGNTCGAVIFEGVAAPGLGSEFEGMAAANKTVYFKDLPIDTPGAVEGWDEEACAAYTWDEGTGEFMTYDDVESVRRKARFVGEMGLGGMFFWEASGDKEEVGGDDGESLVGSSFQTLMKEEKMQLDMSDNLIDYPQSVYDNVRAGFS